MGLGDGAIARTFTHPPKAVRSETPSERKRRGRPYEILLPLGAGGITEVYRARDERLKRDGAIKVLPASYSQGEEVR